MRPSASVSWLSVLIVVLALIAASGGLFWPTHGSAFTFTTLRGEIMETFGHGLYRYDSTFKGAGSQGTDTIVLVLGVPLLLGSLWLYRRGSWRGGLLLSGTLAFFLYVYASMALATAYNELFLVYVVLFSASFFAFTGLFVSLQPTATCFSMRLPFRGVALFLAVCGVLTAYVWLEPLAVGLVSGQPPRWLQSYTPVKIRKDSIVQIIRLITRSLLIVVTLAMLALSFGFWNFRRMVDSEITELFAAPATTAPVIVTEAMLADLPEPVQRYLRYSDVVGKPIPRTVRLQQQGRFRTGSDQPWMNIRADEYYNVDDPGFLWDATFYMGGLPILRVRDSYRDGRGHLLGKIGGLVTMLEDRGDGVDQGTMLRYLQEMTWFPAAFLGDNIAFGPIDDSLAQVTFTDHGRQVTGTLVIDEEGKLTNFIAQRYRSGETEYGTWTTPMTDYAQFEELMLPRSGKGVWLLPEGDLEYIDLEVTAIEYDVAGAFGG